MKKLLTGALSAALLLTPTAFAANDLEGNWAKPYIEYLGQIPYNNESGGVIRPNSATGNYDPDKQVTRAEFMRYVNRAFNFTERASVSQYTDLSANGWYLDTVQIAAKHGYISGTSADAMSPNTPITREQVISVLGRLFKKELPEIAPETLSFTDNSQIGKWSAAYIKDAVDAGIVHGYMDGSFRPYATVTRAEIASLLYFYMGSSLNQEGGVYSASAIKPDTRNVTISAACTLQDVVVPGDLYITEGVTGTVTLTDVTIQGDLIQSGGSLLCNGVSAKRMIVDSPMGRLVETAISGDSEIDSTVIRSAASLAEKDLTGDGFIHVTLEGDGAPSLTLDGAANVTTTQKATITTTAKAMVGTLTANASVTVSGYGSIGSAVLNAPDCSLSMVPLNDCVVKKGLTAEIAGKTTSGSLRGTPAFSENTVIPASASPSSGISPAAVTFDRNPDSDGYQDLVVDVFTVGDAAFRRVTLGNAELHASFSGNTITIRADILAGLHPGDHTLTYVMSRGDDPTVKLTVIDTSTASAQHDLAAEWSGDPRDDVEFLTAKGSIFNSTTDITSVKCNGSSVSRQAFHWELTGSDRLSISIDGEEVSSWFAYYNNPEHLDFDIKLTDLGQAFTVRIQRKK